MDTVVELSNDFTTLLDILGFIQGIILGILLLTLHKGKKKSTLFLGLFLIFFSLKLLHFVVNDADFRTSNPEFFLLPVNFSWLLFALFFIYTQKVSVFSKTKITYWILYPGLLVSVVQLVIYFQPFETKLAMSQSSWYEFIFTYTGIFYSWCIGVWNLILLYRHRVEVRNCFSRLDFKKLQWIGVFLVYGLISPVVIHILYYLAPEERSYKIIFSILDIIAIYWISFHGFVQGNIPPITSKTNSLDLTREDRTIGDTERSPLTKVDMEKIMQEIDSYISTSESFVNTDLTIMDLAKALDLHPKRISTVINTVRNQNFNTYVNQFRIKKAKLLLTSKEHEHLSIEGIGNEAGFHSKSSFYTAFKRQTGTTPTNYREKNRQEAIIS